MDNNASLESLLSEINPDYRAWLTIYDTNIDYPVMQGEDDLFYASRDIYKEVSLTGSIYLAAANTNGRLVVMYVATRRNLITVDALGQTWTYDGQAHTLTDLSDDNSGVYYTTNYPGDDDYPTTVEYSIDDGVTWTTEPPTVTNVSESTDVIVRVTNDAYGRATVTVRLEAQPKAVTVTANPAQKIYGQGDPTFTATVNGVIGNETVSYTVTRPGAGTDEAVDTYHDALIADGDEIQGNYTVSYFPADFTILPAPTMILTGTGFEGVYDAQTHTVSAVCSVTEGTTIRYSIDGGETWLDQPPTLKNVGDLTVLIQATNPNFEPVTVSVPLKVAPRPVTVQANPSSKVYGARDPGFSAVVTGLLGRDKITYTVSRPGAGTDEDVGLYEDAIVPAGEELQGNYIVTYIPADFRITASDELVLNVSDYIGVYDAQKHQVTATVNIKRDTYIEYSTDGGLTWRSTPPSITDVGEVQVLVRARNKNYETVTASYILKVTPRPVTVQAHNSGKPYGDADPTPFTATVTGLLGKDTVEYTVSRPGAGTDENAGLYVGAIVPEGEELQGNYIVTYIPGDFEITRLTGLTLNADGFVGVYDGQAHAVEATTSTSPYPEDNANTVIEYSLDGGNTWTTEIPSLTNVGEVTVLVRATNPNYETVQVETLLKITRRQVTVTVNDYSKISGDEDPEFTATVVGLLDGDEIVYTISREPGEAPGTYAVMPTGEAEQGNYAVVFVNGKLVIINNPKASPTPSPTPGPSATPGPRTSQEPEETPPYEEFIEQFQPRGGGKAVWALVNLLCLIVTVSLFLPLLHLGAKYDRARLMSKVNKNKRLLRLLPARNEDETWEKGRLIQLIQEAREKAAGAGGAAATGDPEEGEFSKAVDTLFYQAKRFRHRFSFGVFLELIFSAVAVIAFILTEDMRLPMTLIDKWTPLMILLMVIVWVLDVVFIRYRRSVLTDEEDAERRRLEREQAARNGQ